MFSLNESLTGPGASSSGDDFLNASFSTGNNPVPRLSELKRYDPQNPLPLAVAVEVGELFKQVYGDEYPDYIINDPRAFCSEVSNGSLISFVARSTTGEIIGHAALVRYNEEAFEFGRDVVSPASRGIGLSKLLVQERLDFIQQEAGALAVSQVVAETVTGHARSQNTYIKHDFIPSGVYAGIYTDFFGQGKRETTVLKVRLLEQSLIEERSCYLPSDYSTISELTYNQFGAKRTIDSREAPAALQDAASYSLNTDDLKGFGLVKAEVLDSGNLGQLLADLASLEAGGAMYSAVSLSLSKPEALAQINELREAGFVYCGIKIGKSEDQLILQKVPPCWLAGADSLILVSDHAKLISAFISAELQNIRT